MSRVSKVILVSLGLRHPKVVAHVNVIRLICEGQGRQDAEIEGMLENFFQNFVMIHKMLQIAKN